MITHTYIPEEDYGGAVSCDGSHSHYENECAGGCERHPYFGSISLALTRRSSWQCLVFEFELIGSMDSSFFCVLVCCVQRMKCLHKGCSPLH